jgi:hypothetical protein
MTEPISVIYILFQNLHIGEITPSLVWQLGMERLSDAITKANNPVIEADLIGYVGLNSPTLLQLC